MILTGMVGSNIKLKENISDKKIGKIFFLLVAIIPLFLGSMCTITDAAVSDNNTTKIEITFPPDKALVKMTTGAQGTAVNVPDGKKLWIVVSDGYANYFPQTLTKFDKNNTSEWRANSIGLGDQSDGGMYYRINAVLADENANSSLTDNISKPMPFLPKGAERVDYVVVERVKYPTFCEEHSDAIIGGIFVSSSNLMGFQSQEKYNSCSIHPYSNFGG